MIDAKEIEFYPPETPNVIIAPIPNHDKGINVVNDVSYVSAVSNLTTPLMIVKKKLLQASLFLGCIENCYYCVSQSNGCCNTVGELAFLVLSKYADSKSLHRLLFYPIFRKG